MTGAPTAGSTGEVTPPAPGAFRSVWPWLIHAVHVLTAFVTFDHIEDDAFIYFRVGAHLAAGDGYVFNAGGERIEVGSSIVWQALVTLAHLAGLDLIAFVKTVGVALGAVTLQLLLELSRQLIRQPLLQGVPSLLLAVTIPFYGWIQRGLETSLYVFSIVFLGHCLADERRRRLWPWAALLVCLARSEGPIVLFGLSAFFWYERANLKRHLRGGMTILLCLTGVALARFVYFHDFVPHPFYLKIQEIPGAAWHVTRLYFEVTFTWVLLLIGLPGLALRATWQPALVTLAVLNVPFLLWSFRTFSLVEYNRHLVPALPLLYLVTLCGVDALAARVRRLQLPLAVLSLVFATWLWTGAPAMSLSLHPRESLFVADLRRLWESPGRHVDNLQRVFTGEARSVIDPARYGTDSLTESWSYLLGEFIRYKYPPGITIAFDQMGQTPWYSGLDRNFIDTWGLTYRPAAFPFYIDRLKENRGTVYDTYRSVSEHLIRQFWHEPQRRWSRAEVVDHLFAIQPHVIILSKFIVDKKDQHGNLVHDLSNIPGHIAADPRLGELYVEREKFLVTMYERKDLAARITWRAEEHVTPGVPGR